MTKQKVYLPPNEMEWREVEFGNSEHFEVKKGESITKDKVTEGKIPVVAGGQQPAYYHNKSNRQGETITISGSGAYAGFVNYFKEPIFASDCSTVQIKGELISPKYTYLFLKSYQSKIYRMQKGIAQPHVYPKDIVKIKIPLPFSNGKPSLAEQERIVKILEKAENQKERCMNSEKLLKEYLNAVFNEMFYNKGFEEIGLGDEKICEISGEYGSGAGAREYDGKTRYIRITDISEDGNLRNEIVSPSIIEDKYLLKIGDLLFARTGATVGKTYLHSSSEKNYQYAGYLIRFRFNEKIKPEYVYYFTKTDTYLNWVSLVQKVVAQPNINAKQYSSLKIPLPPLPLQQKFVKIVNRIEKMRGNVNKTESNSEELFNSLLNKAFRGEL